MDDLFQRSLGPTFSILNSPKNFLLKTEIKQHIRTLQAKSAPPLHLLGLNDGVQSPFLNFSTFGKIWRTSIDPWMDRPILV